MTPQDLSDNFKVGSVVKIRNSLYGLAEIVELRGALGPKGARIYRVCVRKKPSPTYTEAREDQLELVSPET